MALSSATLWAVLGLIGYVLFRRVTKSSHRKLPPGPKPLPVLGNIRDMPPAGAPEFQHWLKHKDLYGGVSSVSVMGTTLVLIHDRKAALSILEHTASKTSGRPVMNMAGKLCGFESVMIFLDYGTAFRRYRKLMHQAFGTQKLASQFYHIQEDEVNRQLVRTLAHPDRWLQHLKTFSAGTVLKIAYGYSIEPQGSDVMVEIVEKVMANMSVLATPMTWAPDIIPVLRHLPDGFPGATFQKTARTVKKALHAAGNIPYRFVQRQMAAHSYRSSYVSNFLQQVEGQQGANLEPDHEEAILWSAASLYGASSDTTVASLSAFTMAMINFPQVQHKAQKEIDSVVGTDRLPNFNDRSNLPYVNALIKEVLRFWPTAPMGFPHIATDDVEYDGMHIPRGALVLPASWWFLHDPDVYPNPHSFEPERFLAPRNELDPSKDAFGYGRRACPGEHIADANLYINIVKSLACFNFAHAVGPDGKEIEVVVKVTPGVLMKPPAFDYKITPRSDRHVELIRQCGNESAFEQGDSELLESVDSWDAKRK